MFSNPVCVAVGATTFLALCSGTQAQESSSEIYGQLGISLTTRSGVSTTARTDLGDAQISSSYFGFRGREDLGGGLGALYRLESAVAVDTGGAGGTVAGAGKFFNRQSYVGLDLGTAGVLTLGRQFHASTDRVVRTVDPQNAAGGLAVVPIGLFGVNRFVGNDTRVDNAIKYRVTGPAGLEGSASYGLSEDVAGKSYSAEVAQLTPAYQVAAFMVNFSAPTVVAGQGNRPQHRLVGVGANAPVGPVRLYANYYDSKLDATVAARGTQHNKITTLGVEWRPSAVSLKLIYYHDQGSTLNGVAGRDGRKGTLVATARYYLSRRTSLYGTYFENRFSDGYKLESVNLAALGRDPNAAAVRGISLGILHTF